MSESTEGPTPYEVPEGAVLVDIGSITCEHIDAGWTWTWTWISNPGARFASVPETTKSAVLAWPPPPVMASIDVEHLEALLGAAMTPDAGMTETHSAVGPAYEAIAAARGES